MFNYPTDAYVGDFSAFEFDVTTDLPPNSTVVEGQLVGVTREPFAAGQTGTAFMAGPRRCFSLPKASGAVTRGAIAYYDAATKKVTTATGEGNANRPVGVFWAAADAADTFALVLLS